MMRMYASIEDIRQTQKMHSSLLHIMLRQLQSTDNRATAELPADLNFPMSNDNEIANLEQQLADPAIKKALVSIILYYKHCMEHGVHTT